MGDVVGLFLGGMVRNEMLGGVSGVGTLVEACEC